MVVPEETKSLEYRCYLDATDATASEIYRNVCSIAAIQRARPTDIYLSTLVSFSLFSSSPFILL